uniref:BTB domain-containing protein n=1 Tax=Scylla olivacea TaxID=85551 RepID=A0A0P4W8J0_SCYOL
MGDGMLSLYWNNHRATFCHILATLREKERYTDATLACDGKFYPVHKLVLSTCSEYFEKIFEHTPCKHPVIVLKDIKADALEALLNYMYAGYVNVAQNDLARLIKAAETLSIKGLAVPDEPPPGEDNKSNQSRSGREERTSPQPKRRRREENASSQPSNSPPSSPRASPYLPDGEQSRSRAPSEGHRSERVESTEQAEQPPSQESQASEVKVMVDESLVKEEMVETLDNSQSEGMDTSMQYGGVGSDPSMDGTGEEHSNRMLPNKYDQPVIPGQAQPLADAVAEALAGPSGMQGWLGSEMPGPGGYTAEAYGSEGNQEVHPAPTGASHSQQRAAARMSSREAKGAKNSLAHRKVSCISKETGFITKTHRRLPFRKRNPISKAFFYGNGKFCAQTSFRFEDKMWYGQLLQQLTGVLPSSHAVHAGSQQSPASMANQSLGMVSRSRCSSVWTQEKRQQLEASFLQSVERETDREISMQEPIFLIPKPPVKLSVDEANSESGIVESDGRNGTLRETEEISPEQEGKTTLKNSLDEYLRKAPIYNLDWLESLRNKFEVRAKASDCDAAMLAETQRLLEEKRKKSQASLDNCVALRMKHLDLTYPGETADEDEQEEEFVPLTPEMEEVIDNALMKGPPNQVLIEKFNTQITRHDISTLAGLNWLNDEIINFYMNLLIERGKNDNYPKVYAFNTFFYPKLMKTGFASVKRWTKKVDLFSHDLLLIPVHLGMHWCLATIDLRTKCVRYFDSMLGDNDKCLEALLKYLEDEHQDKKSSPFEKTGWMAENVKDIPQQMNGSDCGMFACMFAEYLSRDADITFDQQHMPYFRRKMVYEIVTANLL